MIKSFLVGSAIRRAQNFRKLGKNKEVECIVRLVLVLVWVGFLKQEKNSIKRKYMWMQICIFLLVNEEKCGLIFKRLLKGLKI